MNRLEAEVQRNPLMGEYALHLFRRLDEERVALIVEAKWQAIRPGVVREHAPSLTLDEEAARRLMDSLWGAGVRPSRDVSSTGQAEATGRHLEDLQGTVNWLRGVVERFLPAGTLHGPGIRGKVEEEP